MSFTTEKTVTRTLTALTIGLAAIALSGCSLLSNVLDSGSSGGGTVEGEGDQTDIFSIEVGDCLNDAAADSDAVNSVPTVDCAEPHDSEVYDSVQLPDGDFPGDQAVTDQGFDACEAPFGTFVGVAYADSTLDYSIYSPTEDGWANGDREVLCIVFDIDADGNPIQSTGSLAGAAR
jgi:hypothetical protein